MKPKTNHGALWKTRRVQYANSVNLRPCLSLFASTINYFNMMHFNCHNGWVLNCTAAKISYRSKEQWMYLQCFVNVNVTRVSRLCFFESGILVSKLENCHWHWVTKKKRRKMKGVVSFLTSGALLKIYHD